MAQEDFVRWQDELERTFRGPGGLVGERLIRFHEAEQNCQRTGVARYKRYVTVGDAFFDFAIQSLDILSKPIRVYHIVRVPLFVSSVSRLRSSYILFWMGYYFDAASLLRGVFENAINLCADAHGWADVSSWFDAKDIDLDGHPRDISKKMQNRIRERNRVVESKVFRSESGLSQPEQDELALLVKLMHSHVHRTEMHVVHLVLSTRERTKPASTIPVWDDHLASHYGNISLAIAWMFVRLLSHAVPEQHRLPQWTKSRDVLEKSLRFIFEKWDKPIGAAIIRLIDTKFAFEGEWAEPPPSEV